MVNRTLEFKIFIGILLLLSLTGVIGQFILILKESNLPVSDALLQFFSYFTILTNSLIILYAFTLLFLPDTKLGRRFDRQHYAASLALHIGVLGLIYNTILRFSWEPIGLQLILDDLLHLIVPLFYIIYWIAFVPKTHLKWTSFFAWLAYPLIYLIVILLIAAQTGFYPYPFIDVDTIGWNKVFLNIILITTMYILFSLILIGITKLMVKSGKRRNA